MTFHVYILKCSDGSYYTGHTKDLELRLHKHHTGAYCGYTTYRRPLKLVFSREFPTRDQAFQAERQIKGWSRRKKEALINGRFDLLPELSRSHSHHPELILSLTKDEGSS